MNDLPVMAYKQTVLNKIILNKSMGLIFVLYCLTQYLIGVSSTISFENQALSAVLKINTFRIFDSFVQTIVIFVVDIVLN